MRLNKITFALGVLLIMSSRLSVAALLDSEAIKSDSAKPYVLIGDANGAAGAAGGNGGDGGS